MALSVSRIQVILNAKLSILGSIELAGTPDHGDDKVLIDAQIYKSTHGTPDFEADAADRPTG